MVPFFNIMTSLNHIGIACGDPAPLRRLFEILSLSEGASEKVLDQGLTASFFSGTLHPVYLELLQPLEGVRSPISEFLAKRGPGIHHLSFLVEQPRLEPLSTELRLAGFVLLYEKARLGAHGMMINFVHPKSCSGILIELMEPAVLNK